jgi:hypothetical protein
MRRQDLNGAVLWMLAGALCLFCAGLLHAVSVWDVAATDRAYVDATARAAQAERDGVVAREASGMRLWVPSDGTTPDTRLWQQQIMLNLGRGQRKDPP